MRGCDCIEVCGSGGGDYGDDQRRRIWEADRGKLAWFAPQIKKIEKAERFCSPQSVNAGVAEKEFYDRHMV